MSATAPSVRSGRLRLMLEMIRFSHTLFALPFAALATLLALRAPLTDGQPPSVRLRDLLAILLCMIFARSAAMAFNRLVDHRIDEANPRTRGRHLPAGSLKRGEVWAFTVCCSVGFIASCGLFLPNVLPLAAALPVLAVLLGYSLAKRFTAAAHFWLGAALSLAPVCVWVALRGSAVMANPSDLLPAVVLAAAVAAWVAGFDIIYACQDEAFDRQHGLHSIPARLGARGSLRLAAVCHAVMVLLLLALPICSAGLGLGGLYLGCLALISGLLIYEHRLVAPGDLQRVNVAFFHVNAIVSVSLLVVGGIDSWLV